MTYSQKFEQLLGLDDEATSQDYAALGFTFDDAKDLINIATYDELLSEDEDSSKFWAAVHAWCALGQLQVLEAIEPLLDLIDKYPYDLLYDQKYPEVFKLMGKGCIPILGDYLNNPKKLDHARGLCCHYLGEMGKVHRAECVEVLTDFLKRFENHDVDLNSFAVSSLMDLSAVESIDIIRQAFQKNSVNINIPGDLEDVEIDLGLRMHRETPRPDYGMEFEEEYESTIVRQEPKIGRNDPCPCGSGKKYKKCCLH